jgi:hypothetical protein
MFDLRFTAPAALAVIAALTGAVRGQETEGLGYYATCPYGCFENDCICGSDQYCETFYSGGYDVGKCVSDGKSVVFLW